MTAFQEIRLRDRVVAVVVGDQVLIGNVEDRGDMPRIRAMAAYASEVVDGTLPGPYRDVDAEAFASEWLGGAERDEENGVQGETS